MSKNTKIWLIIATSLVVIGCLVLGGIMTMLNWDFTKLSTDKYVTSHYEINENFKNISIITNNADIMFAPSENAKKSVICYEQKNAKHSVAVHDNTLAIEINNTKKWYDYIGINSDTPKITVFIPQGEYGALSIMSSTGDVEIPGEYKFKNIDISENTGNITNYASASEVIRIKTSTGNICVENMSAGALDLSVSTGKVTASGVSCESDVMVVVSTGKAYLTDISCKNLISSGNTGDLSLKNVIAAEKFSIERSTGDVKLDDCDSAEILIKTDTGDITGSLLTDKIFITRADTGSIEVPKTITGGKCEISTNTGNIKITTGS